MSSKHFGKSRIPLEEAFQRAVINVQHHAGRTAVFGKPTVEVRVVPPGAVLKLKPKPKLPLASRPKSSGDDGNIRVIRAIGPNAGLPWVPSPPKQRKAKVHPEKLKVQSGKKANTSRVPSRKILVHERQPRFEGGIHFVQGGLPYLGKR